MFVFSTVCLEIQVSFYQRSNVSQLEKLRSVVCATMMHVFTDYVTYDAEVICIFHKEYVINSPKICNYVSSQRFSEHSSKISIIFTTQSYAII